MKLTNCNCGQLVDCGCTLSFDSWQNNTISVLSVGNLVGGSCTFDEYVIDWYRDGHHAMVSGKGYDPDIQSFHPFTGLAAIPVEPGQWKPVLRYVVMDGKVLYARNRKCKDWCMDLQAELPSITVPFITVNALHCGLVGTGNNAPALNYDFSVRYQTTQDFSLAERTFRMMLDGNGDTGYVAVRFQGDIVADKIETFYRDETTPLNAYVVGTNLTANNPNVIPQEIDYGWILTVANMEDRTYQTGDYITIKVTPSVKEPGNFNTIWRVDLKCLPKGVFECNLFHPGVRTIDVNRISLSWNEPQCRYELLFYTVDNLGSSYSNTFFGKYLSPIYTGGANTASNSTEGLVNIYLRKSITASAPTIYVTTSFTNMSDSFLAAKTGNILTFEFADSNDYNAFKDSHAAVTGHARYLDYSPDPTSHLHYKFFHLTWRETMLSCGDTFVLRTQRFHISSPVAFDDSLKKITIGMLNVSNGIIAEDCNSLYSVANSLVLTANGDINKADWSGSTRCRNLYPFNLSYTTVTQTVENTRSVGGQWYLHLDSLNTVCELTGWDIASNGNFIYRQYNVRVTLTNPSDALNNFRVESRLNTVTGLLEYNWTIIYEKQNGQQIIP